MPELIHAIAARLRRYVGNRRAATRYKVQRRAGVLFTASLQDARAEAAGTRKPLDLRGYTRDISEIGLALVVPGIHIHESYVSGRTLLEVKLELPGAPVMIEARPVRYERVDMAGEKGEKGTLICVQITGMRDRDRASYTKYLRRVRKHEERQQAR